jgi:hypothetical protein
MSGTGGFQTQVYPQQAIAVAGDFASNNPYFTFDAGPGGLVAGPAGVTIGRFAWVYPPVDPDGTGKIAANNGAGPVAGFVHRELQGTFVNYLGFAGTLIQPGYGVTLMTGGDFWVVNDGTGEAETADGFGTPAMKAFAQLATGKVEFHLAGTIVGGASATGSSIAAAAFSVTGSVADDVLTVTVVGSGTVVAGGSISGTGIATGTKVISQVTPLLAGEAAGGIGRYLLDVGDQSAASTTVSGTYGILTIGTATGTFVVGDILTGTNVVAGTAITQNLTGSGGTGGTMVVTNNTVVASTTITASTAVETKWYAMSAGLAGELVKISSHPLG